MSDQLNAGVTSETAQTWKTIHTKHTLSQTNKANMEWWWRRPNYIRGPWGLQFPDICFTGEEKPRKKPHPGKLSRPGIEPGPAAWQARMLPLAPQRWTGFHSMIVFLTGVELKEKHSLLDRDLNSDLLILLKGHWDWVLLNFDIAILIARIVWFYYPIYSRFWK